MLTRGVARGPGDGDGTEVLRLRVAAGAGHGDPSALPARVQRAVAVAERVGAPLLDVLDAAIAAEDDRRRASRAVAVASAQTRAVAVGLVGAPVVLVPVLGRLAGADLAGFYTSGVGVLVLLAGGALLGLGALAIAVLVRRVARLGSAGTARAGTGRAGTGRRRAVLLGAAAAALAWWLVGPALAPLAAVLAGRVGARRDPAAGAVAADEAADLTATALLGGVSPAEALRVAAGALPDQAEPLRRLAFELELGLRDADADRAGARRAGRVPRDRLALVLATADEVGAPAVAALRRLGADLRAEDLARVLAAAERLPAQLTFPTALCLLPGTVLLVGAPIVHAGLATVGT